MAILLITLLLISTIQNVQNVCISSSTLAESIIKSSPSLCFNNNDTNILNHRLIDESLSINSSIITQPSLSNSIENVAESRQIPVVRSKLIKNNNNNNGGNGRKKKRKVYKIHGHHHYHPTTTTTMVERLPIQRQRKKSIFIPVALYSVTKKLPKNSNANLPRKISSSSNVSIRRNPSNYQDNFDGQDYQQQQQQDGDDYEMLLLVKGITAKGLLLASIPLLLSPLLSYMLTPVVIPITATVAAGRRRRRKRQIFPSTTTISDDNDMDDIEIILKFLQPIFQQNDLWLNKAVANFLNHDGFFQTNDHCFEQLACQIVDDYHQDHHYLNSPSSKTSKLDKYQNTRRVAASLILKHLLQNEFVTKNFKKRIEKIIIQQKHRVEKKQWWKQCSNQYKCNRFVKKKIKQQQNKQI
ncbi:hypothetical protein DERP_005527 [Dermatophagoides pteronyssinus]|uniref:Uncharacterized protein n=1 Tax=Dermatophagoides pteronyssinus TaxID=6956 RepID=A0ABQ8JND0_DERPT|nr:hypothetical protein DERP_005527 [Dermatophagoides pteronyssinus]